MKPFCNTGSDRKVYFDALRVLAIFGVLFNHTNTRGFAIFTIATDSVLFPFYLFCAVVCKIAVPIFLMITGALLLEREEPISVILKKRFCKFFFVLLCTALIIYLYFLKWNFAEFSFKAFIQQFYSTNITASLWYLYAYLAYILTLPFLRRMARNMQNKDYLYLTGLMLLISLLRSMELLVGDYQLQFNEHFDLFITAEIVYYPLMGDFLANKLEEKKLTGKLVLISCAVGLVFVAANCWLTCVWCGHLGEWEYQTCQNFLNRFIFVPAASTFLLFRFIFMKVSFGDKIRKVITYLGSCTFGIYLFERIYREKTLFVFDALEPVMPRFVACLIWIACAFLVGLAVTAIAKKLPLLRKIL